METQIKNGIYASNNNIYIYIPKDAQLNPTIQRELRADLHEVPKYHPYQLDKEISHSSNTKSKFLHSSSIFKGFFFFINELFHLKIKR
jgi:hypothetical protein